MPLSDPLTYVSKIAEKTGISGKTQGAAIAILGEARQKRFSAGKDPMGLAAAALYIACLQNAEKKHTKRHLRSIRSHRSYSQKQIQGPNKAASHRNTRAKNWFIVFFAFFLLFSTETGSRTSLNFRY